VYRPRSKQQARPAIEHASSQRRRDVLSTFGRGMAFDGDTDPAGHTVCSRGSRLPKADETAPKFDDGLQHHRTAAPLALHGSLPSVPHRDDPRCSFEQIKNIHRSMKSDCKPLHFGHRGRGSNRGRCVATDTTAALGLSRRDPSPASAPALSHVGLGDDIAGVGPQTR
jgi:hypothetical protein